MVNLKLLLKYGKIFTIYKQISVVGEEERISYGANNTQNNNLD